MKIATNVMQGVVLVLALGVMTSTVWAREARIAQGEKSGELHRSNAERLEQIQQKIKNGRDNAPSDGTVTESERSDINIGDKKASESIFHPKHNGRRPRMENGGHTSYSH